MIRRPQTQAPAPQSFPKPQARPCYHEHVTHREEWRPVLTAETARWSAMSCEQLIAELHDVRAYEVEAGSKWFQVEVQLLENTEQYVHVMVAVDDGSLPASISPLTETFMRYKTSGGAG